MKKNFIFWTGLITYAAVLFIFLTLHRIPAERLIASTLYDFSGGAIQMRADHVRPSLPARCKMEGITARIFRAGGIFTGRLDTVDIGLDFSKIFSGYYPLTFKAVLAGGAISGNAGTSMKDGLGSGYLKMNASGVGLEDLDFLTSFSDRNLKGSTSGTMNLKGSFKKITSLNGVGDFTIQNGSIATKFDLPGIDTVPFDDVKMSFKLENGLLSIKEGELKGPMFSGTFSGTVQIRQKIAGSRLHIEVRLNPTSRLLNNPIAGQLISKIRKDSGPIYVKIGGTIKNPAISLNKN